GGAAEVRRGQEHAAQGSLHGAGQRSVQRVLQGLTSSADEITAQRPRQDGEAFCIGWGYLPLGAAGYVRLLAVSSPELYPSFWKSRGPLLKGPKLFYVR